MTTDWQPVRQARTHELVLEAIEEQVLSGRLKAGDRLPPERELAPTLGVSRPALREALRVMEGIGVLVSQVGRGPDAGARIVRNPDDALGRVLRLHLALGSYSVDDVLEARIVLERSSVEAAARQASEEDLAEADAMLARMEEAASDVAGFNDLDTAFHVLIARSSGNHLVSTLTSAVRESVRTLILQAEEAAGDWERTAAALNAEHAELLRLIRAGDGAAAAALVERHIRGFHGTLARPAGTADASSAETADPQG
ncbi:FCD domain-containing protein [Streptomyces sp. NPDC051940]|uniref:FadR/GntR family transcriptional regulator n=1 Tax=Streptomyces sp. NPDC051940 TaxID=3155675 RepID=UPI00344005AD